MHSQHLHNQFHPSLHMCQLRHCWPLMEAVAQLFVCHWDWRWIKMPISLSPPLLLHVSVQFFIYIFFIFLSPFIFHPPLWLQPPTILLKCQHAFPVPTHLLCHTHLSRLRFFVLFFFFSLWWGEELPNLLETKKTFASHDYILAFQKWCQYLSLWLLLANDLLGHS